ncbi:MAG: peroxiredoxin, partial [Planctomycetes bacterium]|nr:peroxiredoxin [Planctomycetota bacterium]
VRCVFIIDPSQKVRAMVYYPLSNGRSIAEILRLVEGLQTTDANGVATPEGWKKGDPVIVPPPVTQADAAARLDAGFETTSWYFCKKTLGES